MPSLQASGTLAFHHPPRSTQHASRPRQRALALVCLHFVRLLAIAARLGSLGSGPWLAARKRCTPPGGGAQSSWVLRCMSAFSPSMDCGKIGPSSRLGIMMLGVAAWAAAALSTPDCRRSMCSWQMTQIKKGKDGCLCPCYLVRV